MTNHSYYIVLCGRIEQYSAERSLPDMTWAGTVRQIAEVQFSHLRHVVEVGTGRDVTAQIIREAADYRVSHDFDQSYQFAEMVELVLGTRAARPFFRRAA